MLQRGKGFVFGVDTLLRHKDLFAFFLRNVSLHISWSWVSSGLRF
jgi:hypothetical protein